VKIESFDQTKYIEFHHGGNVGLINERQGEFAEFDGINVYIW